MSSSITTITTTRQLLWMTIMATTTDRPILLLQPRLLPVPRDRLSSRRPLRTFWNTSLDLTELEKVTEELLPPLVLLLNPPGRDQIPAVLLTMTTLETRQSTRSRTTTMFRLMTRPKPDLIALDLSTSHPLAETDQALMLPETPTTPGPILCLKKSPKPRTLNI